MIPVLTREQMRAFDAHAIKDCKVPSLLLMENAGRGAADVIERQLFSGSAVGRRIVVVCGTGNNGGDGFVVARHLMGRGADVRVWLAGDPKKETPDCKAMHAAYKGIGGKFAEKLGPADLVIDALFGTGLDRPITGALAQVIETLNAADAPVAALDVPSGLDTNTGVPLGKCIEATLTVTFAHLKLAHVTGSGAALSGPVHVVDIGVPPWLSSDAAAMLAEASDVRAVLEKRPIDTHKYRAGHVALLAGSPGKTGAALLAAQGALRGGAGAATVITSAADVLEARIPEVMVQRLDPKTLGAALEKKKAALIGPGFGTDDATRKVAEQVLKSFKGPIVADADAFTLFAGKPKAFAAARHGVVLTPHSGELGRLIGRDDVDADRFEAAKEAAKKTGAVVLLKGAYTVVASPEGDVVVTGSGSPALATAGSGDVLAGLVTALACTLPPFEAAWVGAFLHGVAGTAWAKEHGDRGMLAGEIAGELPSVIGALLGNT